MASTAASSQHRCVFVGNIPYDATEEQLVEICREVGPVVSFRLVTDRETGKPKGYGFCEYKDEETALSARRNLQGYEINGRQLRVDFAENDKNADRSREQGRGGPGMGANVDHQKPLGGSAIIGEASQNHPIGLHIAMTAATVMSGALGSAQIGMQSNQSVPQNHAAGDPLTFHLAKMSRNQLNAVMSELKVMATQNREAARQLLLAKPQLSKALFQAQIMLGMVTPQVLQMLNIRQTPSQLVLHSSQDARQPAVQTIPTLPPLAQKTPIGLAQKVQQGQSSALPQNSLMHNQFSLPPQPSLLIQTQSPHIINNVRQQPTVVAPQPPVMPLPPVQHPSIRPAIQMASSASLNQQIQPPFPQHMGTATASKFEHNSQKPGPLITPGNLDAVNTIADRSSTISGDANWGRENNVVSTRLTSVAHDSSLTLNRPSKLRKLDDGKRAVNGELNVTADRAGSGPAQSAPGVTSGPLARLEEPKQSDKQTSQLSPDMESVLLQQVLNLTPEQLSSLPPEQRQQVIQLQQALRQEQMQAS